LGSYHAAFRWLGLTCRHEQGSEAMFPEQLAHRPQGGVGVAPTLDQHVEHLTLMVDGAPQVHSPAGNADHHLVEMPARARAGALAPQFARDNRTKFQDPTPNRLMGKVETALRQELPRRRGSSA
jgi:hypothetical protein